MQRTSPLSQRAVTTRAVTGWAVALAGVVVVAAACQVPPEGASTPTTSTPVAGLPVRAGLSVPPPPSIPLGAEPVEPEVSSAADLVAATGVDPPAAPEVDRLAMSGDLRQGWLLVDALHFHGAADVVLQGLQTLTGQVPPPGSVPWVFYGDLLLAWDVPPPPGYLDDKRALFVAHEVNWRSFFDAGAALDWRAVSWVGLERDAITALDDPEVATAAVSGEWLPDEEVVFGVVVGGEARAYPRRVLEVHEVVNDTVGGQPLAIAYCTPCQAATAYDRAVDASGVRLRDDGTPVLLRASGLAERGITLLFDQQTDSLYDQLGGRALAGRMHDRGVTLGSVGVRVSTWGAWKAAFPETTVISDDAGIGRVYVADPLQGREAEAEFPVGPVDQRRPADSPVLGVRTPAGMPIAFAVDDVVSALDQGGTVELDGVRVVRDAGGLAALSTHDGAPLVAVEARWFAWAARHPNTGLWTA
jgi:hypothetical protein